MTATAPTCDSIRTCTSSPWMASGARRTASSPKEGLRHLRTSEVGEVLERVVRRMERHLRRSGQLRTFEDEAEADGEGDPEGNLAASAVLGPVAAGGAAVGEPPRAPRAAGPLPTTSRCARRSTGSRCTRRRGRALSIRRVGRRCCATCCALRWPEERVEQRPDGLVRITLKKAYPTGRSRWTMDQAVARCWPELPPALVKNARDHLPHPRHGGGGDRRCRGGRPVAGR